MLLSSVFALGESVFGLVDFEIDVDEDDEDDDDDDDDEDESSSSPAAARARFASLVSGVSSAERFLLFTILPWKNKIKQLKTQF